MKLDVITPEENMGDVIGDLNKRRGQVEGMESSRSGARVVKATVPLAEMFGYVTVPPHHHFRSCYQLDVLRSPRTCFEQHRQVGTRRNQGSCRSR